MITLQNVGYHGHLVHHRVLTGHLRFLVMHCVERKNSKICIFPNKNLFSVSLFPVSRFLFLDSLFRFPISRNFMFSSCLSFPVQFIVFCFLFPISSFLPPSISSFQFLFSISCIVFLVFYFQFPVSCFQFSIFCFSFFAFCFSFLVFYLERKQKTKNKEHKTKTL